jgi:hypothetical protein
MDFWAGDKLGYKQIGVSFTNLIKSIDTAKVISIEAGYGRGKTFFRNAWAQHLRESGEIVIEIDVRKSDHSGDPVVTFLGALVEALPRDDESKGKKAIDAAKKFGAVGARSLVKMALRSGAEEILDSLTETAMDKLEDFDALDKIISDVGEGMSKAAGQLIAAQMAAEKVRTKEMPEQLKILHSALTKEKDNKRVIIIIDELDRCHPDYAISVLEAMKLVFDQEGYVFCLMVNAEYIEKLAQHRFGKPENDEKYLDKFIDLRLRLEPANETFEEAVKEIVLALPLKIPLGDNEQFQLPVAAELAGKIATKLGVSMRKTKRILLKVEMAMRCYSDRPIDAPMLVYLAFKDRFRDPIPYDLFKRAGVTPVNGREISDAIEIDFQRSRQNMSFNHEKTEIDANHKIGETWPELLSLSDEELGVPNDGINYHNWKKVHSFFARDYIPSHQRYLDAVEQVLIFEEEV